MSFPSDPPRPDRVPSLLAISLFLVAVACSSGGGGDSTGGMVPPSSPTVQPTIESIQTRIFTPKCALSGCHTGATPQPIQGAGLDLSAGASLESLLGANRQGVASTIDPAFERVLQGNVADSYLYMKIVNDPRIDVPLNPGVCSITTTTTCTNDGECPAGETCSLRGASMPKNGSPLTAEERGAIAEWILNRQPGDPGPPGY